MRAMALGFLISASSVAGQMAQPLQQALTPTATPPATWDPAAQYVTLGQDEPGYRNWYLSLPGRAQQVKAFNDYLASAQVAGILPTWQLLRTASSWKECDGQPFEVPPAEEWPHMIQTLRYIKDYVVPAIGPVEPVSAYRNPSLNVCAGGAPESAHKLDSAVDLVPLRPITRETLMRTMCDIHSEHGAAYNAGLGFYAYLRFHVDSIKFRRWNMDPAVAAQCPPIIRPEDVASVGQPLPPGPSSMPTLGNSQVLPGAQDGNTTPPPISPLPPR
jgi:hypothetical protein